MNRSKFSYSKLIACTILISMICSGVTGGVAYGADKVEVVVQLGHTANIWGIVFSPDGRFVASGGDDTLILWDVASGREVRTFDAGNTSVLAFSPDGKHLLSGSNSYAGGGSVHLWDVETGKEVWQYDPPLDFIRKTKQGKRRMAREGFTGASFSEDGRFITTVGTNGYAVWARGWETRTGRQMGAVCAGRTRFPAAVLPDGKHIITGSGWSMSPKRRDGTYDFSKPITGEEYSGWQVWRLSDGRKVRGFADNMGEIHRGMFCHDKKRIVFCFMGEKATTIMWDVASGKEIMRFDLNTDEYFMNWVEMAFSPDKKSIWVWGKKKLRSSKKEDEYTYALLIFDALSGKRTGLKEIKAGNMAGKQCEISPDAKLILIAGKDYVLRLWDFETGRFIREFKGDSFSVRSVDYSPDGNHILTGGYSNTRVVRLWDLRTGREIGDFHGLKEPIRKVRFTPDGKSVVAASRYNTLKIWNLHTSDRQGKTIQLKNKCEGFDISKDGTRLLTAEYDYHSTLYELPSGTKLKEIEHKKRYEDNVVAFSPDGHYISAKSGLELWEMGKNKPLRTYKDISRFGFSTLAFSPDGQKILAGHNYDHALKLYNVKSKRPKRSFGAVDPDNIMLVGDGTLFLPKTPKTTTSVSFSPDGQYGLSSSGDKTIKLWDLESGAEVRTFIGHTSWVSNAVFSPDGKRIFSGSMDNTAKLWNTDRGETIATFVSVGEEDFAIFTPDHYYTANKDALRAVHFRMGNKVYPFEQFDLRLNRPDIVLQRIGQSPPELIAAYKKAYLKRLKKMGFTEKQVQGEMHLPTLRLLSRNVPFTTKSKTLSLRVNARDSKHKLNRLNVYINDVPIYGTKGLSLKGKSVQSHTRDFNLELSNGKNKIQISCHNEKGTESLKETVEVIYDGPIARPNLYVVAVGVNKYADPEFNLEYAAKDARDLAAKLKQAQGRLFGQVRELVITDTKATKTNILKARAFLDQTKVDDHVVLFVAGHALLDEQLDYYYATHDTNFSDPAKRGLAYEFLTGLLDGIPARRKLLLMDTCHSGELDKEEMEREEAAPVKMLAKARSFRGVIKRKGGIGLSNSFLFVKELFADLRRGTGAAVITSSSGDQYSLESKDWNNGVFTYAVLDGLKDRKADKNKDGRIRVSELRTYVMDMVVRLTRGGQTPTSRKENLADDFVVY